MERWCFRRDDDCHWYLLPVTRAARFSTLLEMGEAGEEQFFKEGFDDYRGSSPSDTTFTDPK